MKRMPKLNVILAAVGCASLLVYILACSTSFSPDDSQVLYPAFDNNSGAISIAVYDRKSARSETLFTAVAPGESRTNRDLLLARAQWLPDGKHVLIGHVLADDDQGLSLFVVPRGVNEPIRHLPVPDLDQPAITLEFPFCVLGSKVFLASEKMLTRVDLMTGLALSVENTNEVWPLAGDDQGIAAAGELDGDEEGMVFGTLDPQTLAFKPALTLTNKLRSGVFPNYIPRDRQVVFVSGDETNLQLNVVKDGKPTVRRPILHGNAGVQVGPLLHLGPRADRVFTTYISKAEGAADAEYGVVEIPLNQDPLRWTPLFRARPGDEEEMLFAQSSLSHDGQTWAMATSLLYVHNPSLKPEDCALFLVEVGSAKPKITKVPVPPPAQRRKLTGL